MQDKPLNEESQAQGKDEEKVEHMPAAVKRKRPKGRRKKRAGQFTIFFNEMYQRPEWKGLSVPAKLFYKGCKGRYTKENNGEIIFPFSAMRGVVGCSSPTSCGVAVKELIEKKWIKVTYTGGDYRKTNIYELTFKFDLYDGKDIDGKKKSRKPYTIYERQLFHAKQWKKLAASTKIYYECLKGQYLGYNNGRIKLSYSDMRGVKGCSSRRAVNGAIKELEAKGWIERTQIGGMLGYFNLYKLTFRVDLFDRETIATDKYQKPKRHHK